MAVARFCAVRGGLRSHHWTVKSTGPDEYIIARSQAGKLHLTLHRDGELHVRIDTRDGRPTYPIHDYRATEVRSSTYLAVRVVIPPASCTLARPATTGTATVELRAANESAEFALYYEAPTVGSGTPVGMRLPDTTPIGAVTGRNGSQMIIVARRGVVQDFTMVSKGTLYSSEDAGPHMALIAATPDGILLLEGMDGSRINMTPGPIPRS